MKKAVILMVAAVMLFACLPVFAQQFPDVPADHWAYQAISDLAEQGIIEGYPDGTFGGKRAATRYEFAQALAKAIPVIAAAVSTVDTSGLATKAEVDELRQRVNNLPGGTVTPPAAPQVTIEQFNNLQRLVDEFRDELAAQGVDIEALRRDLTALGDRVTALEKEVSRIQWTGEANMIAIGRVDNEGDPYNRDDRYIGGGKNLLANSDWFNDFDLGIKARIGGDATLKAVINAGNYTGLLLGDYFQVGGAKIDGDGSDFRLWNLYLDAPLGLGPLGKAQVRVGRFPFQLTPLTMKFVDPDSYTNITKFDNGDYVIDGGAATMNFGKLALTGFAAKAADDLGDLITPDLLVAGTYYDSWYMEDVPNVDTEVCQFAGARAVIGGLFGGNLGLTYLQTGNWDDDGRGEIMAADLSMSLGRFGIKGEYAISEPNDRMIAEVEDASDEDNTAWNAGVSIPFGKLGLGVGYQVVESNYFAPGAWSRLGRAVNLTNVKGPSASLTYSLGSKISFTADGSILEPENDKEDIFGRFADWQGAGVWADDIDQIVGWKAGIKYALTSANSIDLGYEQVNWEALEGPDDVEKYISIGIGHSFNPNASLKLLYQIVEHEAGAANPYDDEDFRGGMAVAQFQAKY